MFSSTNSYDIPPSKRAEVQGSEELESLARASTHMEAVLVDVHPVALGRLQSSKSSIHQLHMARASIHELQMPTTQAHNAGDDAEAAGSYSEKSLYTFYDCFPPPRKKTSLWKGLCLRDTHTYIHTERERERERERALTFQNVYAGGKAGAYNGIDSGAIGA